MDLRQHDFPEGTSCPPAGSSHQECRNILLDLRSGAKRSLADPSKQVLALKSCNISSTRPHLLLVVGVMPLHVYMIEGCCHLLAHVGKECSHLLVLIISVQCIFQIVLVLCFADL
ncbi:hypothetical protein Fmac_007949 [Flemingia macrophylla]|uniref:Uncharacterized protein n=1 Tax=Flemingia macrophylla TaxID=520843 RepID=A0ABD1MW12_9FABA